MSPNVKIFLEKGITMSAEEDTMIKIMEDEIPKIFNTTADVLKTDTDVCIFRDMNTSILNVYAMEMGAKISEPVEINTLDININLENVILRK